MNRIAGDDVAPWNLLHDGSVTGLVRRGDCVTVRIEVEYLRSRFAEPGDAAPVRRARAPRPSARGV